MMRDEVIGREELKRVIDEGYSNYNSFLRDVIIVKGNPGIGKTYSVTNILMKYDELKVITCKQSKFEENEFSLLKELINTFFREVLMFSDDVYKPLIYQMKNKIGKDLGYLPNFSTLIYKIFPNIKRKEILDYAKEKYKIRKAVREVLRLISREMPSVCIFLDDLQWSDFQSIDIIKSIIKDDTISVFLIISYRAEFEGFIKEEKSVKTLLLKAFEEEEVSKLIVANTASDVQNLSYLTRYLYSITFGNPFYVIKAIEDLKTKGVIEDGSVHINKLSLTKTSEDIEGIMLSRVEQLTNEERSVLDYLVCLFGTASKSTLKLLYKGTDISDVLESLKSKHFIFETPEKYTFTHDIILEYISENLSDKSLNEINYEIAYTLYKNDFDMDAIVMNFINTDPISWDTTHANVWFDSVYNFAKHSLNSQSYSNCEKALAVLEEAKGHLTIDPEIELHITFLRLRYKYVRGDYEDVENKFNVLIKKHSNDSMILHVYDEMLSFYKYMGQDQNVIDLGKVMLNHLDYKYDVSGSLILLEELSKPYELKVDFELIKNDDITALYVLYQMTPSAKNVSINDFLYIVLSIAKLSLEEEDTEYKLFGYTALSYIEFNMLGRFDYGKHFSDLIFSHIDEVENYELRLEIISFYLTFVHHWSNDLIETTKLLDETNLLCLENGFVTYFSYTIASLIFAYSAIGKNIDESMNLINERTSKLYDITLAESSFLSTYINPMMTAYINNFKIDSYTVDTSGLENVQAIDMIRVWFELISLFLKGNIKLAYDIVAAVTCMFDEAKGNIVYTDIHMISGLTRIMNHSNLDSDVEDNLAEIHRIKGFFESVVNNYVENHLPRHLYISGLYEHSFGNKYLSLGLINEGIALSKEKDNYLLTAIGNLLAYKVSTENETLHQYYKDEMIHFLNKFGATAVAHMYQEQNSYDENDNNVDVHMLSKNELCTYYLETLYEGLGVVYSAIIETEDQPKVIYENKGQIRSYDQLQEMKYFKSINHELVTYSVRTKEEITSIQDNICIRCVPLNLGETVVGVLFLKYHKDSDEEVTQFMKQYNSELTIRLCNERDDQSSMYYEMLSPRELGILRILVDGKSNKEIGEIENISLGTVKSHLSSIYGKLEVNNRVRAIEKARELKIL